MPIVILPSLAKSNIGGSLCVVVDVTECCLCVMVVKYCMCVRVMKHISPPLYSHRKERALKIYTVDLPSKTKLSDISLPDQPPVD